MHTSAPTLAVGLLTAVSLTTATPALAYLSPTQVFVGSFTFSSSQSSSLAPPPTPRETPYIVGQQQYQSYINRSAAQQSLFSTSSSSLSSVDTVASYGAAQVSSVAPLSDEERYRRRKARIGESQIPVDQNGTVLHSGAPNVAGTGPATTLAVALLTLAGIATIALAVLRPKVLRLLIG